MSDQSTDKPAQNHDLSCLGSLTPDSAAALRSHWFVSVEQFVAAAATAQGLAGLTTLLDDSRSTLDALLEEARTLLGNDRFVALQEAHPGGPLGAHFDDPEGRSAPPETPGGVR